ncbi:MAG TPA: hypothetical protein VF520_14685 [Thermoleophilaceae bacterium]
METPATTQPNEHDRFVLRQKLRPIVNQYEFSLPGEDGEAAEPFCFVHQRRFKFKEDIRFFADASRTVELMRIKARQRFDPRARYDVTAPDGTRIGEIQKVFGKSLLRSTYTLFDWAGNEVATVRERSMAVALVRRLVGFVPYLDYVADFLPIPYDFVFVRGEAELGSQVRRRWRIRDVYTIDMTGDPSRSIDRRLVLAIAVGMDALQAR